MELERSEEQKMLADGLARLARERGEDAPEVLAQAVAELGALALVVPEAAGGLATGRDGSTVMVLMEAIGRGYLGSSAPFALAAAELLGRGGAPEQIAHWLEPAMSGEARLSFGRLEAATQRGGRLCGRVALSWAAEAYVLVSDEAAWLVPGDAPGLMANQMRLADGSAGVSLELTDVQATALDCAPSVIAAVCGRAEMAASALMLGIMERLLEETREYVSTRQQFGVAIGRFQVIAHRMARLYVNLEQCRSLVLAAASGEGQTGWRKDVAAARAFVSEAARLMAHEAVQFHGGMGITAELAVTRGHRQIMVLSRLFGPAAAARADFIAA